VRRGSVAPEEPTAPSTSGPGQDELRTLEARIAHLEHLVEGLQDSVHRESTRLSKRIGDVEARIQPAALGRALSDDARDRGL
jgi:hypothetical protein